MKIIKQALQQMIVTCLVTLAINMNEDFNLPTTLQQLKQTRMTSSLYKQFHQLNTYKEQSKN